MSIPHRVNKDDWFDGMLIPKDASVILPTWAMHLSDELGFKDAGKYNPDRYLNFPRLADSYAGSPDYNNRDHYGYGAGRRICPGIHLAERTQWRMTANILWAFEVKQKIDPGTGKALPIDPTAYHQGISHCPKEFPVEFKPRSQAYLDTITRELNKAQEFLAAWDD